MASMNEPEIVLPDIILLKNAIIERQKEPNVIIILLCRPIFYSTINVY